MPVIPVTPVIQMTNCNVNGTYKTEHKGLSDRVLTLLTSLNAAVFVNFGLETRAVIPENILDFSCCSCNDYKEISTFANAHAFAFAQITKFQQQNELLICFTCCFKSSCFEW